MKVWLPYPRTGGGADIYCENLAGGLKEFDWEPVLDDHFVYWMYWPWPLKFRSPPNDVDVAVTLSQNGIAFRNNVKKLVVVEHHCVFDPAFLPYRNYKQKIVQELLVRSLERRTFQVADAIVAISNYTATSLKYIFGISNAHVILNGIDTDYFSPGPDQGFPQNDGPIRLLFVGNLTRRKGADLLPMIMDKLGNDFVLEYTSGLRSERGPKEVPNMKPLGRLSRSELRESYRRADILLFPTRFEGFGLTAAEALACGTPVVTTNCSSLPEIVEDRVTGRLCEVDDVDGYVEAIRELCENPENLRKMSQSAREAATEKFTIERMAKNYVELFSRIVGESTPNERQRRNS